MFTGIVQACGRVTRIQPGMEARRVYLDVGPLDMQDVALGHSIAVNGVCLTVAELHPERAEVAMDVSSETLAVTSLAALQPGVSVNLEKALSLGDRLGGHLVSGHVDGVALVLDWEGLPDGGVRFTLRPPSALLPYLAVKGSVCLDGVSLTINQVLDDAIALQLIPHTLLVTTLGSWQSGQHCNIEVDLIARYLDRLRRFDTP